MEKKIHNQKRVRTEYSCCGETWITCKLHKRMPPPRKKCRCCKKSVPPHKWKRAKCKQSWLIGGEYRMFGIFRCDGCERSWASGYTWTDEWGKCMHRQKCVRCLKPHLPVHLRHLKCNKKKKEEGSEHRQDLCEKCEKLKESNSQTACDGKKMIYEKSPSEENEMLHLIDENCVKYKNPPPMMPKA